MKDLKKYTGDDMQFRVCVFIPSAREQGIKLVDGLDVGELGMCVVEIPTEEYEKNLESSSAQIFQIAADYMSKIVNLEIIRME